VFTTDTKDNTDTTMAATVPATSTTTGSTYHHPEGRTPTVGWEGWGLVMEP
jgi:hypothetical protein